MILFGWTDPLPIFLMDRVRENILPWGLRLASRNMHLNGV